MISKSIFRCDICGSSYFSEKDISGVIVIDDGVDDSYCYYVCHDCIIDVVTFISYLSSIKDGS